MRNSLKRKKNIQCGPFYFEFDCPGKDCGRKIGVEDYEWENDGPVMVVVCHHCGQHVRLSDG